LDGLAAGVGDRWTASGQDPDAFVRIATEALVDHRQPTSDPAGAALRLMAATPLPPQHNLGTGFGQPPVTIHRGDGFITQLLFWFDETIAIHDHRFTGAFAILDGVSLHTTFQFHPQERVTSEFESGELKCTEVELLHRGDVRPIALGRGLIHSNFHFGHPPPTLSIVVRTVTDPHHPQHLYSRSGLAFAEGSSDLDMGLRRQGLAAASRISPEAGLDYLQRSLVSATPDAAMSYLIAATGWFGALKLDPLISSSSLGRSEELRGRTVRHLQQVQSGLVALSELERLSDPNDRMLMAMIAAGTDWSKVDAALLGQRDLTARAALAGLVTALASRQSAGPARSRLALSPPALELARSLSVSAPPAAPEEPAYRELATHRVLGPLFRHLLSDA
jgi:hypothetical protein